ncbi:MAG: filamentous hemagglutinin N-terminal domain-containing protein [Candidatus Eremiobacteraeota bacterium]|nr:filamentous hemagglutinin N-terminal domain-containing protein [Candidatus Eremiobacteraeota bacterium]MCW5871804.1 filamentous hemagglutinin N-terminal domain-containing protein [Candidatus Eremiobacteraeota bacterium]
MRLALALSLCLALPAPALPGDPNPVHGQIQIQTLTPNLMQILQSSPQAIVNWNAFNIGSGETVRFLQPSSQAAILNRVTGLDPSLLQGQLQANGRVFLLNPNGILFGPNSVVDVGSFTASTLKMSDEDFLSGNYRLTQDSSLPLAALTNQGQIRVAEGGFVVLVSPLLDNQGAIIAQAGTVQLGATTRATFSVDGRGQVAFAVPDGFDPHFQGGGQGGTVLLQSGQMSELLTQVVSRPNLLEAASFQTLPSGQTLLSGGEGILLNSGSISADSVRLDSSQLTVHATGARLQGQDVRLLSAGGTVSQGGIQAGFAEVSGHELWLQGPVVADTLLLDPDFIEIVDSPPGTYDGDLGTGLPPTGSGTVSTSAITATANLILSANQDITYNGNGFSGPTNLELLAGRDILFNTSDATISLGSLRLQAGRNINLSDTGSLTIETSGDLEMLASAGDLRLNTGGNLRLEASGGLSLQGVNLTSNSVGIADFVGAGPVRLAASGGDLTLNANNVEVRSSGASTLLQASRDIVLETGFGLGLRGLGPGGQLTLEAGRDLTMENPLFVNLEGEAFLLAGRNLTYIGQQLNNAGSIHMRTISGNISLLSQPGEHTSVYAGNVLNITSGNDLIGRADDRIELFNGNSAADYLNLSAERNIDLQADGGHVDIFSFGGTTSISAQNITSRAQADSIWASPSTLNVQATTGDLNLQVVGGTQRFRAPQVQVSAARDLILDAPLDAYLTSDLTSLQANRNLSVNGISSSMADSVSLAGGNISLESMDLISGGNFTLSTPGNLTERTPSLNPPDLVRLEINAGRIFSPNNTANNVSFAIPHTAVLNVTVTGSNDSVLGAAASLRNFNGANVQPQVEPATGDIYVDGILYHEGPREEEALPPAVVAQPLLVNPEERSQIAAQSNLSLGNLGGFSRVLSEGERERTTARADSLHQSWNLDPFSPTLALALPGGTPPVYPAELAELAALLGRNVEEDEDERVRATFNALVDQELREIWEVRYWRHLLERFVIWEDRE